MAWASAVTCSTGKVMRRPQKVGRVTRLPAFFVFKSNAETLGREVGEMVRL